MDLATALTELETFIATESAYRQLPAVTSSPWVDRRLGRDEDTNEYITIDITLDDLSALYAGVKGLIKLDNDARRQAIDNLQDYLVTTRGHYNPSKTTGIRKHPKASGAYLSFAALELLVGHADSL